MSVLTSSIPAHAINTSSSHWRQIRQLKLADPSFHIPNAIDVILGSDQLWNLYLGEIKTFGSYSAASDSVMPVFSYHAHEDLDTLVRTFLEIDNVQASKATIEATDPVEQHFGSTHTRTQDGTYIVNYPFKDEAPPIYPTLSQAKQRFSSLERQFRKDSQLKQQYVKFINDYEKQGHMELLSQMQIDENPDTCVYLAHHAVLKPSSSTTKCRVVFDGSGKDEKGFLLNDRLHIGPSIQRVFGRSYSIQGRQSRWRLKHLFNVLVLHEHTPGYQFQVSPPIVLGSLEGAQQFNYIRGPIHTLLKSLR
ncbi:uncharacterized protein [Drosophila tropicalis]|uniref:uncharacterized protein n=1 Tax=Drosophila tropicalis TaxID=46794 RepID=UPI0035AC02E9